MTKSDDSLQNLQLDEYRQKEHQEKQRIALEYFNLLIYLINEQAFYQRQLIRKFEKDTVENKVSEKPSFEKNIHHALTLLASAYAGIEKDGPSAFTDYLITSALSYLAKSLPTASIKTIVNQLDSFNKNHSSDSTRQPCTNKISSTPSVKQNDRDKNFNDLISRVSKTLLTPEQQSTSSKNSNHNQIVIDFAADKLPYRTYGIKRAKKLGANLIQAQPDQFVANNENFSISKNMTLTLIGHCCRGANFLCDNAGHSIDAAQIAEQLYSKMSQTGTPLETEFTIDLIACQAASPSDNGEFPSFAEHLIKELAKRGIKRASVIASPTIMTTTHDGSQANLSIKEDHDFTGQLQERNSKGFFDNLYSSVNSFFTSRSNNKGLLVKKVIFQSDSAGNVMRIR